VKICHCKSKPGVVEELETKSAQPKGWLQTIAARTTEGPSAAEAHGIFRSCGTAEQPTNLLQGLRRSDFEGSTPGLMPRPPKNSTICATRAGIRQAGRLLIAMFRAKNVAATTTRGEKIAGERER